VDIRNYPPETIREALLNAIVHRDYTYSGSTLISVFADRIEFVTLGGLPKGISFNDLLLGVSVLRNSRLADVFYRLHLIEAYGTGIPNIMEFYRDHATQPNIEVSDNAFRITLPNMNYNRHEESVDINTFSVDERLVLSHLESEKYVARKKIEFSSGFSQAKTLRLMNSLIDKGVIKKTGHGKNTLYSLVIQ
jgi:ATP-dependent DNA helicase RecG